MAGQFDSTQRATRRLKLLAELRDRETSWALSQTTDCVSRAVKLKHVCSLLETARISRRSAQPLASQYATLLRGNFASWMMTDFGSLIRPSLAI